MKTIFPYIHVPIYTVGGIQFDAFAILVALGVVAGALLARQRTEQIGLDLDVTIDSFYWVLPGGFLLSHIIDVVCYKPEMVAKDPLILIYAWAGISSFGGILGGFLVAYYFFYHRRKLPGLPYMDVLGWGLLVGFTVGRIGCTVAHDHPGLSVPDRLVTAFHVANIKDKALLMPDWQSPTLWILVGLIVLTVALLTSLIREEPLYHRAPLVAAAGTAGGIYLIYPYLPAFVRALAVPRPEYSSVFYKVQMPPMLVWGDFHTSIAGKMTLIKTQIAYDLGLIECIFCIFLVLGGWMLVSGKPRREGFFLAYWFLAYPPVRYLLDQLRLVDRTYAGFTPGQYMAMIMYAIGLYLFLNLPERRWGEYRPLEAQGDAELESSEQAQEAGASAS